MAALMGCGIMMDRDRVCQAFEPEENEALRRADNIMTILVSRPHG